MLQKLSQFQTFLLVGAVSAVYSHKALFKILVTKFCLKIPSFVDGAIWQNAS
jgi:hypothetical protein